MRPWQPDAGQARLGLGQGLGPPLGHISPSSILPSIKLKYQGSTIPISLSRVSILQPLDLEQSQLTTHDINHILPNCFGPLQIHHPLDLNPQQSCQPSPRNINRTSSRALILCNSFGPDRQPTHIMLYSCQNFNRGCRGRVDILGGKCSECKVSTSSVCVCGSGRAHPNPSQD